MAASAQSSFTQRLQQSKSGEGKVTVTQDKAITDLVDGPSTVAPAQQQQQTRRTEHTETAGTERRQAGAKGSTGPS